MPASRSGAGRSAEQLRRARRQQVRPAFARAKFGLDPRRDGPGRLTCGRAPGEPTHRALVPGAAAAARQQRGLPSPSRGPHPGAGRRDPFPLLLPRLSGGMVPPAAATRGRRSSRGESRPEAVNPRRAKPGRLQASEGDSGGVLGLPAHPRGGAGRRTVLCLPAYEKLRGAGVTPVSRCGWHRRRGRHGGGRRWTAGQPLAPRGGAGGGAGGGGGAGLGGPSPLSSPRRAGALRMMRRAGGRAAELPALLLSHRSARHRDGGAAGSASV